MRIPLSACFAYIMAGAEAASIRDVAGGVAGSYDQACSLAGVGKFSERMAI